MADSGVTRRVAFKTLGCKLNQAETEAIATEHRLAVHGTVLAQPDVVVQDRTGVNAGAGAQVTVVTQVGVGTHDDASPDPGTRLDHDIGTYGRIRMHLRIIRDAGGWMNTGFGSRRAVKKMGDTGESDVGCL
jgi:hypothetical protein